MKVRLATVWFGGCAGCHMSILDLDEFLIEFARRAEIVYSPIMDIKVFPEKVDVALIEGAICNEEHLEMARRIRERTGIIVALGDCAVTGNVPAMRNQLGPGNAENVLQRAYLELANHGAQIPELRGVVPRLLDRVMPLHEVVPVDHYLPGCPPGAERIKCFLTQMLDGQAPSLKREDLKFG